MNPRFIAALAFVAALLLPTSGTKALSYALPATNSLIKTTNNTAVYWYSSNGKRYVFPNEGTYFSWFNNFNNITVIEPTVLSGIPIGGNVTYRPGTKMLKIQSDPRTYVVTKGGVLRQVMSESVATALYGTNWKTQVNDINDGFFINYKLGNPVYSASDVNLTTEFYSVTNPTDNLPGATPNPYPTPYPNPYPQPYTTLTGTTYLSVSPSNSRPAYTSVTLTANITNSNATAQDLTVFIWAGSTPQLLKKCVGTTYCSVDYQLGARGNETPIYASFTTPPATNALKTPTQLLTTY